MRMTFCQENEAYERENLVVERLRINELQKSDMKESWLMDKVIEKKRRPLTMRVRSENEIAGLGKKRSPLGKKSQMYFVRKNKRNGCRRSKSMNCISSGDSMDHDDISDLIESVVEEESEERAIKCNFN